MNEAMIEEMEVLGRTKTIDLKSTDEKCSTKQEKARSALLTVA